MCFTKTAETETNVTTEPVYVEKFLEVRSNKNTSSVRGYNYSEHDANKEGEYHSWKINSGKGNAVFVIPVGSTMMYDPYQEIYVSNKIQFFQWIVGTQRDFQD